MMANVNIAATGVKITTFPRRDNLGLQMRSGDHPFSSGASTGSGVRKRTRTLLKIFFGRSRVYIGALSLEILLRRLLRREIDAIQVPLPVPHVANHDIRLLEGPRREAREEGVVDVRRDV